MRNHSEYQEILWIHALDALDGQDRTDFEQHLSDCLDCQKELNQARQTVAQLAFSVTPVQAPSELRQKILDNILPEPMEVKKVAPRKTWFPRLAFGFGIAAIILAISGWWKAYDLRKRITGLENEISQMQSQLTQQAQDLALLRSPASEFLTLAGQTIQPQARGKMIWDAATGTGIFLVTGLPQLPQDKTYQLWVIAEQKPISAGIFSVDLHGRGELRVINLPPTHLIQAFAVTLEPSGGVPQPTGQKYLVGLFSKI